jgi:hypothetical protein
VSVHRPSWSQQVSTRLSASCPGHSRSSRYTSRPPRPQDGTPSSGASWDQQSLANSFNTIALHPPPTSVQDWVADSGASHHTTPSAGNISTLHPLTSSNPSSIIVGNDSSLSITSVGDSVLPESFYLNNILLAMKDLTTNNVIINLTRFFLDCKYNYFSIRIHVAVHVR